MKNDNVKMSIGIIILLLISQMAANTMSLVWVALSVFLLFFIVGLLAQCRKRENVWLFVLTAVGSIPINFKMVKKNMVLVLFDSGIPIVGKGIAAIEVYLLLLALEEIVVGIMGRFIWKKQYAITVE